MTAAEKRGRGRPPVGPDSHVRLPADLSDRIKEDAKNEGVPVAEMIRRILTEHYAARQ